MRQSAAVLCHDKRSLQTLKATLEELGIELVNCRSGQEALELVMTGRCSTLIVDFDLPGAEEVIRMAALLPPAQKPALLAVASRAWPGTGRPSSPAPAASCTGRSNPSMSRTRLKTDKKIAEIKSPQVHALRSEDAGLSWTWKAERFPASASISASTAWRCRPPSPCP